MSRYIYTTFSLLLTCFLLQGQQPDPCVNPVMTPTCQAACVICNIDGFTGVNNTGSQGVAPPDFCTTQAHNVTWIAFIAGSENLTLEVFVSNCQIDWGLEIGIYESLDCQNFSQVSFCNTDVQPNTTATFTNTVPLVIGQYYYFVMDGSNGDVCNYEVNVTQGTTQVNALDPFTSGIVGPTTSCPGVTQTFEAPTVTGANFTEWYLDSILIDNNSETLEHTWGNEEGTFELCYLAYNVCDELPQICTTVTVATIPDISYIEEVCLDSCFYIPELDTCIFDGGFHDITQTFENGCQRQVSLDLSFLPIVYTPLDIEFCFGDTLFLGGDPYTTTGSYDIPLGGVLYCDSIIQLTLQTFLCDIEGGFADDNLLCNGASDGALVFNLVDGVFPYTYDWEEETGTGLTGNGVSNSTSGQINIPNLPSGIYTITVADASGSMGIFLGQVFEPNPILAQFSTSDYTGFGTSCIDTADGSITVAASGGMPPYNYLWFNAETGETIDSLEGGTYAVSVYDANGCEVVFMPSLTEPVGISADIITTDPGCNPNDSGIISVLNTSGGTAPYLFDLSMDGFSTDSIFNNLFPGDYTVSILDANDCFVEFSTTSLTEPNVLILDAGEDENIILGDSIQLNPFTNLFNVEFDWINASNISCTDCSNPWVRPFETTTYVTTATMSNGCTQTDSLTVFVEKRRNFYVPNAFTPNADGINDFLHIFGGNEVESVLEFKVFSRWGELVYANDNFPVNTLFNGWNGTINGKDAAPEVYVWTANVLFLDGVEKRFNGDVTVLK